MVNARWKNEKERLSGAAGGTFGLAALPVELPVSTTIMLRSIAEIARSEGEDLSDPEASVSTIGGAMPLGDVTSWPVCSNRE
jgi:hypothetical protein